MILRRLVAPVLGFLLINLLGSSAVHALTLSKVRYDSKPEYTRFVAEFDGEIKVWKEHNEVFEYNRFWIDVYNVTKGPEARDYPLNDGLINKIKTEYFPKSGVQRFYLEINKRRPFKVWTMRNPDRLVIDVLRDGMVVTDEAAQPAAKASASVDTTAYLAPRVQRQNPTLPIAQSKDRIIIIDPGHGGKSIGAARYFKGLGNVREKDVVLQVALELEKMINQAPNMKAYLTRRTDVDMSLAERVAFSKEKKGHLFISIHCNAVTGSAARGIEFFYVNQRGQQTQASSMLEALENEEVDTPQGGKKSEFELIFKGINESRMKEYATESRFFCEVMNKVFSAYDYTGFTKYNRGVKRANFQVLRQAQPQAGMLLEIGFLSNLEEARKLVDPKFQKQVAQLVFEALNVYWSERDPLFVPSRIASK